MEVNGFAGSGLIFYWSSIAGPRTGDIFGPGREAAIHGWSGFF
jgi:hypothetical protein